VNKSLERSRLRHDKLERPAEELDKRKEIGLRDQACAHTSSLRTSFPSRAVGGRWFRLTDLDWSGENLLRAGALGACIWNAQRTEVAETSSREKETRIYF